MIPKDSLRQTKVERLDFAEQSGDRYCSEIDVTLTSRQSRTGLYTLKCFIAYTDNCKHNKGITRSSIRQAISYVLSRLKFFKSNFQSSGGYFFSTF